jgi:phage gp46-like protein
MTTDIEFLKDSNGDYDLQLDKNGDIKTNDFFDTSILYSIYGERRAEASEVPSPRLRRGWIGSEFEDYENGSKIWLYYQSKITRTILNEIESEAENCLKWMIEDGYAIGVIQATAAIETFGISLEIKIQRPDSEVDQRYFELWQKTGR